MDGGLFLPLRMPTLNKNQIDAMAGNSACQTIAQVLNELFALELTAYDVELAVGRKPIVLTPIGRHTVTGEYWHNTQESVQGIVCALSQRMGGDAQEPTNWVQIAVRIALLFATYAMLQSTKFISHERKLDVAVPTGDFTLPIACWYAKKMGLPIGNIICGCNANGGFWDLINHGEFPSNNRLLPTCTPKAGMPVPRNLERLIHGVYGVEENKRYLLYCSKGMTYTPPEEESDLLSEGIYTAVTSDRRVTSIVTGIYRLTGHVLSPYDALSYGCLQDLRATTGEERPTLLICEYSPAQDSALVSRFLKIKEADLMKRMKK